MRMEPMGEAHLAAVQRMIADPETRRRTLVPDAPPEDFARDWLDRYEAGRRDGSREALSRLPTD